MSNISEINLPVLFNESITGQLNTAKDTGAANAYAIALSPAPAALTSGMMVGIQSVGNTNTGAATLAVNGLSTLPILLGKGTALIGGELVAGYGAILRLNYAGTSWELIWSGAGEFVPPATQSNAAVQAGQTTISGTGNSVLKIPAWSGTKLIEVIEQFETIPGITVGTSGSVTFPIAFPNAISSLVVNFQEAAGFEYILRTSGATVTGFNYSWDNYGTIGNGTNGSITYIAKGY